MKATDFLRRFTRLQLDPGRTRTAEVRFVVEGVEVRLDMVRIDIGDPVTWTIRLCNDPATPGHLLTHDEAEAAFTPHSIGETE